MSNYSSSILDFAANNQHVRSLLLAIAQTDYLEAEYMLSPSTIMNENQKQMVGCARVAAKEFVKSFGWMDISCDFEATQLRRAYEQARDGMFCLEDSENNGLRYVVQASCELNAAAMNYFTVFGYKIMDIQSAVLEFKTKHDTELKHKLQKEAKYAALQAQNPIQ